MLYEINVTCCCANIMLWWHVTIWCNCGTLASAAVISWSCLIKISQRNWNEMPASGIQSLPTVTYFLPFFPCDWTWNVETPWPDIVYFSFRQFHLEICQVGIRNVPLIPFVYFNNAEIALMEKVGLYNVPLLVTAP